MIESFANLLLNAATFVAAATAVYFSHKTLAQSSKQKVAEFRKEWIESLRGEVGAFLAKDNELMNCDVQLDQITNMLKSREFTDEERISMRDQGIQIKHQRERALSERQAAFGSLLLLLNDENGENGELVKSMEAIMANSESPESWGHARNQTIEKARTVFRNEWLRLSKELMSN